MGKEEVYLLLYNLPVKKVCCSHRGLEHMRAFSCFLCGSVFRKLLYTQLSFVLFSSSSSCHNREGGSDYAVGCVATDCSEL